MQLKILWQQTFQFTAIFNNNNNNNKEYAIGLYLVLKVTKICLKLIKNTKYKNTSNRNISAFTSIYNKLPKAIFTIQIPNGSPK